MTGEMFPACGHALTLQRANDYGADSRDSVRFVRKGSVADDRVLGIRVDVEHRCVIEGDADGRKLVCEGSSEALGQCLGFRASEHCHRWPSGKRLLQAGDPSTLLVDADPGGRTAAQGFNVRREFSHLLWCLDVTAEENRSPKIELF